ncbi:hypothetical protein ADLECEL_14000 [Adlercreutzia equolifaciens subsp. celatus]|uniref:Uncharacterized protein n=1 Tax=Adlercreutzia equolifaciens subsp. celatus DSM 18785 TaxID=1121021 RepID=A0A3N0ASN6_9ACTN|nr:hypothetical protein [Adlercreutzia equolifaciens]MCP2077377.1 hypothetical protein [Adlercreutzia equolifaciens subsp. celatus DSM 18785]RFT92515.1 hypothetical protein DX904_06195 [Adlercreutzia equolifaciens subsp. celatus]RNL37891.1 hypothetical protein DMP10_06410 [Adlercreutzia equolifaciens subsp. celatus DSM 18785]BCS57515.1 hypothetical protein ADLECEL_14000 [Adlercreutzia equolifaciens subsp. celatus]
MLNTSIEFQSLASAGARPLIKAKLFLADGGSVDLTGDDFMEGTPSFTRATSSSGSFDVGAAIIGSFSFTLNNFDGRFDEFDFTGSRIIAQVGFELSDGSVEWLRMGTYWTDQPASYGEVIALSCDDSMVKFDVPYDGVATRYPATAATVVSDICERAGVPLLTQLFANSTVVFQTRPKDGCSCRDVLSWAAQATGNFARITNDDRLMVGWYDPSVFDAEDWVDGGEFDGGTPSYESGDDVDGGNFTDYSSGDDVDGGTFTFGDVVSISAYTSISVYTDDVAITGIRVKASDEVMSDGSRGRDGETSMVGSDEYVIDISGNPLIGYGQASETARRIGARCVGLVFRPFDATCHGTPVAEPGDCAVITDRKDNAHRSFITSATYKVGGSASYSCSAEPPLRNASYSQGALTKAVLGMDGKIEQERTAREAALQRLNDDLESASGMYSDTVTEGGASTWYIHDKREPDGQKPGTFSASKFVWKINAAGFGMSVNGGKSYQFGLDKWGSAILNTIYAIGINADHIDAGALRVKSGSKTIFCADMRAGQFWWDAPYSKLTNTGALTITSGKIGGFEITSTCIRSNRASLTAATSGVYIGHDGMSTGNGYQWNAMGNGAFYGGYSGNVETGYVSFNTQWSATGVGGARVAGKGCLCLLSPNIGVAGWVPRGSNATVTVGRSGTRQYSTGNVRKQGSVKVTPYYDTLTNVARCDSSGKVIGWYPSIKYMTTVAVEVSYPEYSTASMVFAQGLMVST